ncbi:MAG TPA: hypothetical protein VIN00_07610, partial [Candidatus Dormibacteraeota bacterium]
MQRAIGEHPLTAPPDAFAGELVTHQDPSVISRTLGHHVSAEAPAGLLLAVARPSTRQDGPAMISRPRLQRRAASAEDLSDDAVAGPDALEVSTHHETVPSAPARELPVVAETPLAQRLSLTTVSQVAPEPVGA